MQTLCPHCKANVRFPREEAGMVRQCPRCGNGFCLPADGGRPEFCPSCEGEMEHGTVVCVACGYNRETGQALDCRFVEADTRPAWVRWLGFVHEWVPGLFAPRVLLLSVLAAAAGLVCAVLSLVLMGMLVFVSAIAVGVAGYMCYAHGVAFMLTGEVQTLKDAMVDLRGGHWDLFLFATLAPGVGFIILLLRVADVAP